MTRTCTDRGLLKAAHGFGHVHCEYQWCHGSSRPAGRPAYQGQVSCIWRVEGAPAAIP